MKQLMVVFATLIFLVLHPPVPAQDSTKLPAKNERTGAIRTGDAPANFKVPEATTPDPYPVQEVAVVTGMIDYSNPKSFFDEGFIGMIEAGVVSLLALLGGFIPGLRKVSNTWVRSGVVILVALVSLATFKAGALTDDFFNLLLVTFLPNCAGTNFLYAAFKNIIGPILKLIKNKDAPPSVV